MDWLLEFYRSNPRRAVDSLLALFTGLMLIDKARDEARIVAITDRLSQATSRSRLGWALRNKGLTLAWFAISLGALLFVVGIPQWDEPMWIVVTLRLALVITLIWNKVWRRKTMDALRARLSEALSGVPQDGPRA